MIIINSHSKRRRIIICIKAQNDYNIRTRLQGCIYGWSVYLLNVPSVSSPYFNRIKRTFHLGKWHALSLEILTKVKRVADEFYLLIFFYEDLDIVESVK